MEDWGTNNQVRKSGNSLFIPLQIFAKVTELTNISDASVVTTRYKHHTCKQAQIMDVVNIPCYLIFLSTLLFNAPRYPSLLNSLHSFDTLSACDDFKALLFLFLCYINIYYIICTPADMNFMICWEISS